MTSHGDWSDWPSGELAVLSAANGWAHERMADHQFAAALSEFIPILYVEPPSSLADRVRVRGRADRPTTGPRLVRESARVARLTPEALPGVSRRAVAVANGALVAHQVRRAVARLGGRPRLHIEANPLTPTLGRLRGATRVYWAQDDFVGMAPLVGIPPSLYEHTEQRILRAAEMVVAANPVVAAAIEAQGHRVDVIPFGCDVELFGRARTATPAADVALEAPIALLMGTLNERLDLAILEAVAGTGISLLIVGPQSPRFASSAFDALVGVPGVQWVGAKDFRELPAYVAHASVGLVPYTHSKFNEGSFPLKTLEYLAAGIPVVATDLPAIRWLGSPDVVVEEEPEAFARRVAELTTAGPDAPLTVRRTEFASRHSWAARAHEFATLAGIIS